MATVNFSVPNDVKEAFNIIFQGKNKSALISDLMRRAVEDEENKRKRIQAIDALLALRHAMPAINAPDMVTARKEIRL